jgi:hypothetical protein
MYLTILIFLQITQPPGEENGSNDAKMMMERMDMDTRNIIDFLA